MKLLVTDLLPGMRLARSVYGSNGEILLRENVILSEKYIQALKRLNITAVYIKSALTADFDAVAAEQALADEIKTQTLNSMQTWFNNPQVSNFKRMTESIEIVIDELLSGKILTGSLAEISATDSYTFTHSIDVCFLSLSLGIIMGFSRSKLNALGMGALLHDLGKTKISPAILHKSGKLTREEYDEIKKHAEWSYNLMREKGQDEIDPLSLTIALQHHERHDGRGYPYGLKRNQIDLMSSICSICDVYNAMTTERVYRRAIPIPEIYEMIMGSADSLFKFEVVQAFLACVTPYPIGSLLKTTAGNAYVIEINSQMPFRPTIYLFDEKQAVDLATELSISITGLLSSKEKQTIINTELATFPINA